MLLRLPPVLPLPRTLPWLVRPTLPLLPSRALLASPRLFPSSPAMEKPPSGMLQYHVLPRHRQVHSLTTCRMGELEPWIDENFIRNLWFQMGEQVNVKMIRDKFSG